MLLLACEENESKQNRGRDSPTYKARLSAEDYPEQLFADKGVMVIEHADFEGIERLAVATGAEIVSTFDQPNRKD